MRPEIPAVVFLFCFLSGVFYAFGQMLQYAAYTEIGVSDAMPLSTGMQLAGNSLMGVLVFSEWQSPLSKALGCSSVALIILGAILTTYSENKSGAGNKSMKKAVGILVISTIGFVGYSAFPRFVSADGFVEFFPQTTGMITMALIMALFMTRGRALLETSSYKNIAAGLVFSVAALFYLISTSLNGVATGFALSQMNVILATLGSIFILKERKTKKELRAVIFGLSLVALGGILIGFAGA